MDELDLLEFKRIATPSNLIGNGKNQSSENYQPGDTVEVDRPTYIMTLYARGTQDQADYVAKGSRDNSL